MKSTPTPIIYVRKEITNSTHFSTNPAMPQEEKKKPSNKLRLTNVCWEKKKTEEK